MRRTMRTEGLWPAMALLAAVTVLPYLGATSGDVVRTFDGATATSSSTSSGAERFNHLVVDKNTGRVYIGAVNRLFQLSPDLEQVVSVDTGPRDDSIECSVLDCPTSAVKRPTDNVNKALVIDYTTTRLISCGTLFQGICSVRNLHNISDVIQEVREAVVTNNATASTVAFIAPGPPNPPVSQVMYVGVTFTSNSPYRSEVPAVSSRSLDKDKMFTIAQTAVTTGTRMFVNSLARERYPINYVYGFSSEAFSYFLTTQLKHTGSNVYISKLVRVCHEDENYYSYTEIPIDCTSDGKKYNLVQAAYVGKAGSDLASNLGITAQDDVLFAVFSESDPTHAHKPSDQSALCVYSLKAIRRKFMQNIKRCFAGSGDRGLDFISPSHPCILTVIDFGLSCFESERINSYLQTRFYRAPEVLLDAPFGMPIDMWSLGCILCELLTGRRLFPGEDKGDQLACIIELLGLPPPRLLKNAKRAKKYFRSESVPRYCTETTLRNGKILLKGGLSPTGILRGPPGSRDLRGALNDCEDSLFIDFVSRCLEWDPKTRMTPSAALRHAWFRQENGKASPNGSDAAATAASCSRTTVKAKKLVTATAAHEHRTVPGEGPNTMDS